MVDSHRVRATACGLALLLTGTMASCSLAPANESSSANAADAAQILARIQTVLDDRNQQIVSGAKSPEVPKESISVGYLPTVESNYDWLRAFKSALAVSGVSYSGAITKILKSKISKSGDHASVNVLEHTILATDVKGQSGPPSEYEYPQIVAMTKGASGWTVDSISAENPDGIRPTTVAP